jgi:RNA polymerase sigma-70 factor (ECF subfamily)
MEADLVEDEGKDLLTVQRSEISDVIDSLPENQQQIVKFVYVDDLTHQEVAEKTKLPLGTVKSRLRLALEKMRKVLC